MLLSNSPMHSESWLFVDDPTAPWRMEADREMAPHVYAPTSGAVYGGEGPRDDSSSGVKGLTSARPIFVTVAICHQVRCPTMLGCRPPVSSTPTGLSSAIAAQPDSSGA